MAVRRMMHILEEKGRLKRREAGREAVYLPAESKAKAGITALRRVLDTFFGGAVDDALAAHPGAPKPSHKAEKPKEPASTADRVSAN